MAALICDLDGSAFLWGTNTFVPGAYEELKRFYDAGNQIIFTTQRDAMWEIMMPIKDHLQSLFPGCHVLFDISSPRIVINDQGAQAINHPRDAAWNYKLS